jgi:hypothetical protein
MVKHKLGIRWLTIERSSDTMCGLHRVERDEQRGFLGLASKLRSWFLPVWP